MTIADIKKTAEQKMAQVDRGAEERPAEDPHRPRAHRLLDHVHVDYYGSPMPLSQVANVTLLDARTISVQPWEKKMVPAIEKAIRDPTSASTRRRRAT